MTATAVTERSRRLRRLASRLRGKHVANRALSEVFRVVLLLAPPLLVVGWFRPSAWIGLTAVGGSAVLGFAALGAFRAWGEPLDAVLRGAGREEDSARRLDRLGTGLSTWLEHGPRGRGGAMAGWLASDLDREFGELGPSVWRGIGRGRRRVTRSLLLLSVLLALSLSLGLRVPWGKPRRDEPDEPPFTLPSGSRPAGGGVGLLQGGAGAGGGVGQAATSEAGSEPPPAEAPDPEEDPGPEAEPAPPEEPAPLLPLPARQLFAVPAFVEDGPTRRARVPVAEVGGGGTTPGTGGSGSEVGRQAAPKPVARHEVFRRAAERARGARHVPENERAIVERFFSLLREEAK